MSKPKHFREIEYVVCRDCVHIEIIIPKSTSIQDIHEQCYFCTQYAFEISKNFVDDYVCDDFKAKEPT